MDNMNTLKIDKIPLPTNLNSSIKPKGNSTFDKFVRTLDIMQSGDSTLIKENSRTNCMITYNTLCTWIKKYHKSRHNLTESQYKKANMPVFDSYIVQWEMAERSIDIDSSIGEYTWTSYNTSDAWGDKKGNKRRDIELKRCKKEKDFEMVEEYIWDNDIYARCTIKIPNELIDAAKEELLIEKMEKWKSLPYYRKCKAPIPTIENCELNYDLSKCGIWASSDLRWLTSIHENHTCVYEHPLKKKWNEQTVIKHVGFRVWKL